MPRHAPSEEGFWPRRTFSAAAGVRLTLRIEDLGTQTEEAFWRHVMQDPLNYYWFILDWRHLRADSRILMAVDDERICGMMLVFQNSIVQLRGERDAVSELVKRLEPQIVELTAPIDCADIVSRYYQDPNKYELILMHMDNGQERPLILHEPQRLSPDDAEDTARVVREANYEWWDQTTAERVRASIASNLWIGIRREGRIVAVGSMRFEEIGCNIGIIATDQTYRNQGFATSIVSSLVQEIFSRHSKALIHVLASNSPALHVYSKVGFRPYRSFFMIRKGQRISENRS